MMSKAKAIKALNDAEKTGACFWSRKSNNVASVFVRGAHGNDPNQLINARRIQEFFGTRALTEIKPDPMSGHLIVEVKL